MKVRLLLSLLLAGLLCGWNAADASTRTQQTIVPQTEPKLAAPLRPVIIHLLKDQFGQQVVRPSA